MKKIIICSVVFMLTYCLFYTFSYTEKKEEIGCKINHLFNVYTTSLVDSIIIKEDIYFLKKSDTDRFKEIHDLKFEDENGIIVVPHKFIKEYDFAEFHRRGTETLLLHTGSFNLDLADSIWNNYLKSNGLNVESVLFLSVKNLREMFPQDSNTRIDFKVPIYSAKHLKEKRSFVTDSIGLGIQNQAYIFSEIHIPTFQIIKNAKWYGLELWIAICISIIVWFYLTYSYSKGKYSTDINTLPENKIKNIQNAKEDPSIVTIGNVTYNYDNKIVTNTRTGEQIKLPSTQAITFELLIQAVNYIVTKRDICHKLWSLNEKDGSNRYNALSFRLRESLSKISDIELQTIKDTALQLSFSQNIKEE